MRLGAELQARHDVPEARPGLLLPGNSALANVQLPPERLSPSDGLGDGFGRGGMPERDAMSAVPWHEVEEAAHTLRRRRREIGAKAFFALCTIAVYAFVFWIVLAVWPG